ncbi:unnamed protein product, partial [Staurois parvus]
VTYQCQSVPSISAAYQLLPISASQYRLSVPISAAYQCQSVPPISAHQCCLSVPSISAIYECCLSVPISDACQCPSVPPTSASSSVPLISAHHCSLI